jgi:hypothetical protein
MMPVRRTKEGFLRRSSVRRSSGRASRRERSSIRSSRAGKERERGVPEEKKIGKEICEGREAREARSGAVRRTVAGDQRREKRNFIGREAGGARE